MKIHSFEYMNKMIKADSSRIESNTLDIAQRICYIKYNELWKENYKSFTDYCNKCPKAGIELLKLMNINIVRNLRLENENLKLVYQALIETYIPVCIEKGKITSVCLLKIYIWSVTLFNALLINIRLIYVLNLIKVFILLATAVLVIASTDVDKTGASYYGEQTLHYIATNGESAVVQLRECSRSLPLGESMIVKNTVP